LQAESLLIQLPSDLDAQRSLLKPKCDVIATGSFLVEHVLPLGSSGNPLHRLPKWNKAGHQDNAGAKPLADRSAPTSGGLYPPVVGRSLTHQWWASPASPASDQ